MPRGGNRPGTKDGLSGVNSDRDPGTNLKKKLEEMKHDPNLKQPKG